MHFWDLLSLIANNLGRRKGRVVLTAIGVIIGTAAVVVLVSLGIGLQQSATSTLMDINELTQIQVSPGSGETSGSSGGVMVMSVGGGGGSTSGQVLLTKEKIEQMSALEHVLQVVPREYFQGGITMKYKKMEGYGNLMGIELTNLADLGYDVKTGTTELSKASVVIGSQVAQNFYDPSWRPGQEQPEPPDLMGQTLRITFMKWDNEGTTIQKTIQVTVAGVLKETRGEADWSIFMPLSEVQRWNEWNTGKRTNRNKNGYQMVIVKVDDPENAIAVTDKITALGLQAFTYQSFLQGTTSFYKILEVVLGGVGSIALLVAAIGIANTMTMAILERTREIGLMKAVGATNRDVLGIFLGEAAGIGFIGGVGGIILGWGLGQAVNIFGMSYLASQASSSQYSTPQTISANTPPWLMVFTLIFSTIIGLLSGLYPALRAATLVPVIALKYE